MKQLKTAPDHVCLTQSVSPGRYAGGPFAEYLAATPLLDVGAEPAEAAPQPDDTDNGYATVFAGYRLQDIANFRAAIQAWFANVQPGGHLVIVVPHAFLYERQNALPSRWNPLQRRLYTPGSLMNEVEESLAPNTYRVRCLTDCDAAYDYSLDPGSFPTGQHDIGVVLQKIASPAWDLSTRTAATKPPLAHGFEPPRTRMEAASVTPILRILILKLDHLGDFIMGTAALQRARAAFPDAHITLVVGSWNLQVAEDLALFDEVLAFDAFPRNATEEKPDPRGKAAEFAAKLTEQYDLAIDLRADYDTRTMLERTRARIKAGIGQKAEFDFLDIFLPIDGTRRSEPAWQRDIPARDFAARPYCTRNRYQITCDVEASDSLRDAAVWGPYHHLPPGRYLFQPHVEFDWSNSGLVCCDVALDMKRVVHRTLSEGTLDEIGFSNHVNGARFEFRFWSINGVRLPRFEFFGGKLIKQGAESVLHQSEYLIMLIELVSLRVSQHGLLREWQEAP